MTREKENNHQKLHNSSLKGPTSLFFFSTFCISFAVHIFNNWVEKRNETKENYANTLFSRVK